jgi:hypothetical protein
MNTMINIIVTVLLVLWGGVLMMSPMMIVAEGIRDNRGSLLFAMAILGYPIAVFGIVKLLGLPYFGMNVTGWLVAVTAIWLVVILLYGLPGMFWNAGKGISNNGYFASANAAYYNGSRIRQADAQSFKVLGDNRYAADKRSVFYYGKVIKEADPISFEPLPETHPDTTQMIPDTGIRSYWRDKNHVYYNGKLLPGAAAASFELINGLYGKDASRVYYSELVLTGLDPTTLRFLGEGIATDGKVLYIYNKRSETPVDLASFTVADGEYERYYRDKNGVYLLFPRENNPLVPAVGADPATFTTLERSYAKDKDHVYFFGNYQNKGQRFVLLEGANPATFTIGYDAATKSEARDGKRAYMYGELVR